MPTIPKDIRFALRVWRNNPGFAAIAIVTLGLGIAANATVFGWIDTILLRRSPALPVPMSCWRSRA
jgi:hypothetical protein